MKLEVGMYVRTINYANEVVIGKITEIVNEENSIVILDTQNIETDGQYMLTDEKPSYDIIDLTEVGDVVLTNLIYGGREKNTWNFKYIRNSVELDMLKSYVYHNKRIIKRILPREQWCSKSFKVGE